MQDCDKDSKNYYQNYQEDFESEQKRFEKDFAQIKSEEESNRNAVKKDLNKTTGVMTMPAEPGLLLRLLFQNLSKEK